MKQSKIAQDRRAILTPLYLELRSKREFWQKKTDDPHNIGNAVICALAEVESAVRKAMWEKD